MNKFIDTLRSVSEKGSQAVTEFVSDGIGYVTGKIGDLPFLASNEEVDDISGQLFDEKHYFLIPYRLSDVGYTFYSMRVLPDGTPPVNSLPKRRVFHFANEHGEGLAQSLLRKEIQDYYHSEGAVPDDSFGNRLIDIANEIDKVDNKISNGLLAIGGLVAVINPLAGAGLAVIPGIASALSRYGLKAAGDKLNQNAIKEQIQQAENNIITEFKDSKTLCVINPILHELEFALNTTESEHDPSKQFDFSNSGFPEQGVRLTKLTCTAITNTYADVLKNRKQLEHAFLGPEDVRWLEMIAKIANEKEDNLSLQYRALNRRLTLVKMRCQTEGNKPFLDSLHNIEQHIKYLLDKAELSDKFYHAQRLELDHIVSSHLPLAIDSYLKLPPRLANGQQLKNGKTAQENFEEQMRLLEQTLAKMADGVYREDAREVIINGQFLKGLFAKSFLDPE